MPNFTGKTALIIEDDSTSVKVLQQLLSHAGVQVMVIIDNSNLVEQLDDLPLPDVIFLDLEMPVLNGYEVLDTLKGHPRLKKIPVVAYTTHTSHMNDARRAGFHSFLGKPLDNRGFFNQLERIFANEPVWEVP